MTRIPIIKHHRARKGFVEIVSMGRKEITADRLVSILNSMSNSAKEELYNKIKLEKDI